MSLGRIYLVAPCTKPRMTQRDKWLQRPSVMRYRAFCDRVRLARIKLPEPCKVVFWIPMPKSWAPKTRDRLRGQLHKQKPDLDNLLKALLDAVYGDDAHVASIWPEKRWAEQGGIGVYPIDPGTIATLAEAA